MCDPRRLLLPAALLFLLAACVPSAYAINQNVNITESLSTVDGYTIDVCNYCLVETSTESDSAHTDKVNLTETLTESDSAAQQGEFTRNNTVTLSESDSATGSNASGKSVSISESLITEDNYTIDACLYCLVETHTTSDSLNLGKLADIGESVTTTDSVIVQGQYQRAPVAESLSESDSATAVGVSGSLSRSVTENLTTSDAMSEINACQNCLRENLTEVDFAAASAGRFEVPTETLSESDSASHAGQFDRAPTPESLTLTAGAAQQGSFMRSDAETLSTSGNASAQGSSSPHTINLSESLTTNALATAHLASSATLTETVAESDAVTRMFLGVRSQAETLTTMDAIAVSSNTPGQVRRAIIIDAP